MEIYEMLQGALFWKIQIFRILKVVSHKYKQVLEKKYFCISPFSPTNLMVFTRPGRRWQNPVLFCHFWEIRYHSQTGNATAKFQIS